MQNFAARILTDARKNDSISPILHELGWPTIQELLYLRDITMIYKCFNGVTHSYLSSKITEHSEMHEYNTRNSDQLSHPKCATAIAQH